MNIKYYIATSIVVLSFNAHTINVFPEIRTVVDVTKTDINRIACKHGTIGSVDYAKNTGLIHSRHKNGKNITLLFQQLNNGINTKIIENKVNIFIECNDEFYELVLNPKDTKMQSIFLSLPKEELSAKNNIKKNKEKSIEQTLIDLIKQARNSTSDQQENLPDIYIDDMQLKHVNKKDILGTNYQLNKFVVIAKNSKTISEKIFLNSKLSKHKIVAVSLDDFELDNNKKYTQLYVVFDKGAH